MRMLGETQIYKLAGYFVLVHLIALMAVGCTSSATADSVEQGTVINSDADVDEDITYQSVVFNGLPSIATNQAVAVLIEAQDEITGHRTLIVAESKSEPFDLDLTALGLPIVFTAFVDINRSQQIERCPAPAQSGQIVTNDMFDVWTAQSRLSRRGTEPLEFNFTRRLCGAGTPNTTWTGDVDISNAQGQDGAKLFLHLKSIHDDGNAIFKSLLEIVETGANPSERLNVKVNSLLPGRHELRAFWDDDQDLRFSPCIDGEVGGGDLGFSELLTFEIMEGEGVQAASTLTVQPSTCTETTTSVSGMVDLSALANVNSRKLSGRLLVEVREPESNAPLYVQELKREERERPSFTLTNLPTSALEVLVYIDRNNDEVLSSCAAVIDGQDLYSARPKSVTLRPGLPQSLGLLQLESHDCPVQRLSSISVSFSIDPAGARKESPRPIYISVANESTNELTLVKLSDNHLAFTETTELALTLAPGNYNLFAFVDTEEDEVFSHCEYDPFGDRARTDLFSFQLSEYELYEAQNLQINRLGCDFPTVQFNLNVDMAIVPLSISQMKIVINLLEAGGLSERFIFEVPPVEPPWFFPINDLVPGTYEVTVHLDQNGDHLLADCSEDGPREVVGQQQFVLDRVSPLLDASLELVDACPESDTTNVE